MAGLVPGASGPTPAGAVAPARTGASAELAAPSCWSIKQNYPSSADGIYWLWTPTLIQPQQFYCDMTTDGGGWVLVGRGREGWNFSYWGQQSPSVLRNTITGTAAFAPAALPTPTVDGLLNGGRMDALVDGVRVRRARNTTGTQWQEVRMYVSTYGRWSWAFGGGIYLNRICFDSQCSNLSNSYYRNNTTADTQINNTERRVMTWPWSSHGYKQGFGYGSNISGSSSSTSYLWMGGSENRAIGFGQVFLRPQISEADVDGGPLAPSGGLPATTVKAMLDRKYATLSWGTTGLDVGTADTTNSSRVLAFAQWGNTIYVGGKFTQVQQGTAGTPVSRPYIAAFNKDTGDWISSFAPTLDGPVWEMVTTPDGKLIVGGEFTNVNGAPNTSAMAALDPSTGAVLSTFMATFTDPSGTQPRPFVRAIDIQGEWMYVGGNFTKVDGGVPALGEVTVGRAARVRVSDGRPDGVWKPNVETAPMDLDASPNGDRVYLVGNFRTLNGVNLPVPRLAVVDQVSGLAVPGLQNYQMNSDTEHQQVIIEDGDSVFQGGAQHFIHKYNRSDYSFVKSHLTKSGGDFQAGAVVNGVLYATCHCNNYQYEGTNTWSDPIGYSTTSAIVYIGAYDTATFDTLPEFVPTLKATGAGSEGPWDLFVDTSGCMWAGGDLNLYQNNSYFYGGFVKFCARDTTPPSLPNASMAVTGDDVTLSWPASTDNAAGSIQYEILRDDPTFGTMVVGSTYSTTFTDADVAGATRYFVRALDVAGNRSATTAALSYSPPPPTLGTIVAKGASWSYRSVASDPGTSWRQPGYDSSSWPTGNAELGWGDGGEATVIPNATTTQYFIRHVNVADPSAYATLAIGLRRDDGAAVYINGIEVARSNLPAGVLAYATLASSFISGSGETTYNALRVPASYLVAGDNVIAVELHQGGTNNGDASFDIEVLAQGSVEANAPSQPAVSVGTRTQSSIALSWPASTDDAAVAGYRVRRNGSDILFTTSTSITDTGLATATSYTYDVIAVDTSGNESTPGSVATGTLGDPNLVVYGASWKWRFDGVDQGTAWRDGVFDDSTWASGNAELGFGDADEATVIWPGTTPTPWTSYFRRQITVSDPSAIASLTLNVIRDDGFVVYINGTEVARDNMPAGTISYSTGASSGISTRSGETTAVSVAIPSSTLVAGTNTIAVEMHQFSNYSTDLSFNLQLLATFS